MSRAFMKDRDDAPEPEPSAPERTHPNYVTPKGLASLQAQLKATTDAREREHLERSIETAIVVSEPKDEHVVEFGATVVVSGSGERQTFTIVGEDEADIPAGKVSYTSPLALALLGARVGNRVTWHRPAGDRVLTIESIAYAAAS